MNIPGFFKLAKHISQLSTHNRCHLGAVIVSNGKPIGVGFNKGKSNPHAPYCGLHAEISAIRNSGRTDLKGCTIFVYRETKRGVIAIAKPCKNCEQILKSMFIKRVFYTTNFQDGFPYFEVEQYSYD